MQEILVIINDPPYGTERAYNGLRLGYALCKKDGAHVRVFLIGDGASCAKRGQQTPNGYYNIERMLAGIVQHGGELAVCGSCMDARGITDDELADGAHRSTMEQLAEWTLSDDKVLSF